MKYATSFLFPENNPFVEAEECDYLSYKKVSLICPECHYPVFLAAKDSSYQSAHFKHFASQDEKSAACSKRAKQLTEKELNKLKAINREQRYQELNKHFNLIFLSSYDLSKSEEEHNQFKVTLCQESNLFDRFYKGWRKADHQKIFEKILDVKLEQIRCVISGNFPDFGREIQQSMDFQRTKVVEEYFSGLNWKLHKQSVLGIIDFLTIKRSRDALADLFTYSFFDYGMYSQEDPISFPMLPFYLSFPWILDNAVSLINNIKWQEAMAAISENKPLPEALTTRARLRNAYAVPAELKLWD
jgi:hypothetical protein